MYLYWVLKHYIFFLIFYALKQRGLSLIGRAVWARGVAHYPEALHRQHNPWEDVPSIRCWTGNPWPCFLTSPHTRSASTTPPRACGAAALGYTFPWSQTRICSRGGGRGHTCIGLASHLLSQTLAPLWQDHWCLPFSLLYSLVAALLMWFHRQQLHSFWIHDLSPHFYCSP